MLIDSADLIRKLPMMIQGNKTFAKFSEGGDYHIGEVDSWCLNYKEIVEGIESYCEYKRTNQYKLGAPVNGSFALDSYDYDEPQTCFNCKHNVVKHTFDHACDGCADGTDASIRKRNEKKSCKERKRNYRMKRSRRMKLYGGIRIGDDVIGITHMPNRKRPCLYYQKDYMIYPLAYFTSEKNADLFWEQLQRFTIGQNGKE